LFQLLDISLTLGSESSMANFCQFIIFKILFNYFHPLHSTISDNMEASC